ncbi:MAG TPA: hypothetical protein VGZ90_09475 [Puia sp.]|jgi:hypothetical protein|nr:hypothetical protein [Puia sp.]
MNKLWKTRKRAPTLIEMAFLCYRLGVLLKNFKNTVKQPGISGTFLHKVLGINGFFSGKTP